MVMEITHSSGFRRCLSKEDFDTLATGEEEANIGKAGVRKFRPLFDFTSLHVHVVANCYYVPTVAI